MTSARDPGFLARLRASVAGEVKADESLARYSTYRIGGPATVLLASSEDDIATAVGMSRAEGVPVFPVGLGSNLLFPDEGLDALVVRIGKGLDRIENYAPIWRFGAGLPAPLAARKTAQAGWAGLHMMVGVPGTVGGGVYMNAGCHGGEWSAVVRRVDLVDAHGARGTVHGSDIPFRYRHSGLGDSIVVGVEVELKPEKHEELEAEVEKLFEWRQKGTPFNKPCCGSVFTNPAWPDGPPANGPRTAGQLIEASGLKGTRSGGVEISPMHANYFVNTGGGTAEDVKRLMAVAQETVRKRYGVSLIPEVKVINVDGSVRR
ncbi:MAG TPA: UDP-N-acetylmuramate dehydrogenase [Gemmatimonadales bacterium]|nr:UDP-N-acetylmuramate dehydrogenase [Gemmatimonadales bacterium]